MKIVKLISENIKKIKAIEIKPTGAAVIIGSKKNGAGKSSVLDSIFYALSGARNICDEPLRHGAKKGKIVCDLGDIVVKRTFNKSGSTALIVRDNDGTQVGTPQQLLDKITGKIGLDPLAFSRMEPARQSEVFRELLKLDFTKLDRQRAGIYSDRSVINQDVKRYASYISEPLPEDTPTKRISIKTLASELKAASVFNRKIEGIQSELIALSGEADTNADTIDKLTFKLNEIQLRQDTIEKEKEKLNNSLIDMTPIDEDKITDKMSKVETINNKYEKGLTFRKYMEAHKKAKIISDMYSDKIAAIDKKKKHQLDNADVPVEGLTFDDAGIFFDNVPFKQLGSGEQLRISVAMGLAMNPKLKVLLIRDGSLLDKDNLQMISDMAEEHDAQVWIERVSEGEECTLIIEDGQEKESDQEQSKLF